MIQMIPRRTRDFHTQSVTKLTPPSLKSCSVFRTPIFPIIDLRRSSYKSKALTLQFLNEGVRGGGELPLAKKRPIPVEENVSKMRTIAKHRSIIHARKNTKF